MRCLRLFLLLVFILTACTIPPTQDASSGIEGQVTIGPLCPVIKAGESCPDKPYQATLSILTSSGKHLAQVVTEANGHFRVSLAPGDYRLRPETPPNQPLPRAQELQFSVRTGQFTVLNIIYDSGIR